jgi:hypothetical protein
VKTDREQKRPIMQKAQKNKKEVGNKINVGIIKGILKKKNTKKGGTISRSPKCCKRLREVR